MWLRDKLLELSKELLVQTLPSWLSGKIVPVAQDDTAATFCALITKEDGKIDFTRPAQEIYNQYRAFATWPGLHTIWQSKILKILRCTLNQTQFV
jgi:methionyl-tRNA formyltransferase